MGQKVLRLEVIERSGGYWCHFAAKKTATLGARPTVPLKQLVEKHKQIFWCTYEIQKWGAGHVVSSVHVTTLGGRRAARRALH
jgi:hypothetical protein